MIAGLDDLIVVDADPETDRDGWLKSRMRGLGGSDAAAVLGEDPNKSAIDVWTERAIGPDPDLSQDSERSIAGRWLEPVVLEAFTRGGTHWPRAGGQFVAVKPPTVQHAVRTWQFGSGDALLFDRDTVANVADSEHACVAPRGSQMEHALMQLRPQAIGEIKTHGWFGSRSYDITDDGDPVVSVPGSKRIQCAWYMSLYKLPVCFLIALVDTHLRRTFVLNRDQALEDSILEETEHFWTNHVVAGVPPPPDGSERYNRYLKSRFKRHDVEIVESNPEVELAVESLLMVKREQKQLQRRREQAEQIVKSCIGDSAGVRTTLGTLTWNLQPSGKMRQREALAELYSAVGWTDDEIANFELRHQQPDHRVLRTPK